MTPDEFAAWRERMDKVNREIERNLRWATRFVALSVVMVIVAIVVIVVRLA